MAYYRKFVDDVKYQMLDDIYSDIRAEGMTSTISAKLYFTTLLMEELEDLNIEDMPDMINRYLNLFAVDKLFDESIIDEVTQEICRKFNFFFEETADGKIVENSISYLPKD